MSSMYFGQNFSNKSELLAFDMKEDGQSFENQCENIFQHTAC